MTSLKDLIVTIKISDGDWSKLLVQAVDNFRVSINNSFFKHIKSMAPNTHYPSIPPIQPPRQQIPITKPVLDERGKTLIVGDIVAFVLGEKYYSSSRTPFGKIKSIELFEDFAWDWRTSQYVRYEEHEIRIENKKIIRIPTQLLRLDQ